MEKRVGYDLGKELDLVFILKIDLKTLPPFSANVVAV